MCILVFPSKVWAKSANYTQQNRVISLCANARLFENSLFSCTLPFGGPVIVVAAGRFIIILFPLHIYDLLCSANTYPEISYTCFAPGWNWEIEHDCFGVVRVYLCHHQGLLMPLTLATVSLSVAKWTQEGPDRASDTWYLQSWFCSRWTAWLLRPVLCKLHPTSRGAWEAGGNGSMQLLRAQSHQEGLTQRPRLHFQSATLRVSLGGHRRPTLAVPNAVTGCLASYFCT